MGYIVGLGSPVIVGDSVGVSVPFLDLASFPALDRSSDKPFLDRLSVGGGEMVGLSVGLEVVGSPVTVGLSVGEKVGYPVGDSVPFLDFERRSLSSFIIGVLSSPMILRFCNILSLSLIKPFNTDLRGVRWNSR